MNESTRPRSSSSANSENFTAGEAASTISEKPSQVEPQSSAATKVSNVDDEHTTPGPSESPPAKPEVLKAEGAFNAESTDSLPISADGQPNTGATSNEKNPLIVAAGGQIDKVSLENSQVESSTDRPQPSHEPSTCDKNFPETVDVQSQSNNSSSSAHQHSSDSMTATRSQESPKVEERHGFDAQEESNLRSCKIQAKEPWEDEKTNYMDMDISSKRKWYRCKGKYVTYTKDNFPDSGQRTTTGHKYLYDKIYVWRGDITTLEFDAIVNAANERMRGGGGVDGAIHRAAGPGLLKESIAQYPKGCDPGDAKITGGYMLPARNIIHTVGPRNSDPKILQRCYESVLQLMNEHNLKTVAIPCISTGIFGYPNKEAANVALNTTRKWLEEHKEFDGRIVFCVFLDIDHDIYERLSKQVFRDHMPDDISEQVLTRLPTSQSTVDKSPSENTARPSSAALLKKNRDETSPSDTDSGSVTSDVDVPVDTTVTQSARSYSLVFFTWLWTIIVNLKRRFLG